MRYSKAEFSVVTAAKHINSVKECVRSEIRLARSFPMHINFALFFAVSFQMTDFFKFRLVFLDFKATKC